jgi:hypothetical protein
MVGRRLVIFLVCLVVHSALLVTCGSTPPAAITASTASVALQSPTSLPVPVLTDINSPEDIKSRFNQDTGVPRLILLVSPT